MNIQMNFTCLLSRMVVIALCSYLPFEMAHATAIVPSMTPLANIDRALSNVVLTISAEFPTADTSSYGAVGSAGNSDTTVYDSTVTYYGYFNPTKCYAYSTTNTYFSQATCSSSTPKGNFLNWASMTVLDQFRQTMTGGLRFIDNATTTVLQRSFVDAQSNADEKTVISGNINAPNRVATSTDAGNLGVVAGTKQSGQYIYKISGMGDKMLVQSGSSVSFGSSSTTQRAMQDCGSLSTSIGGTTPMCYHIRVKVCDAGVGVETNCVAYGSNYKPEGLMQQYNQNMRFAAFGYLADYTQTQDQQGGVLRGRMKSVGPTYADPISISIANVNKEWNASTGVFIVNPDPTDATASSTLSGTTISNSGVINYLNKFGQAANSTNGKAYKYYDPFAELYYDSLRYLRGLPASSQSMANAVSAKAQGFDGFPVINYQGVGDATDPVTSSCQQNFIVAIGDKNNQSCDTRFNTGAACSNGTIPTGDSAPYSTAANSTLALSGLGSSPVSTADVLASGSKWLGGLAYWAHTNDIRPDRAVQRPTGAIQDVTTFIIDVMENHNYDGTAKTQLWMAAKYGGFNKTMTDQTSATTKNNPNTFKTGSTVRAWDVNGNSVPDNWYQGNDPVTMKAGLTNVFQSIVTATSLGDGAAPATSGVSIATANKIYYASYSLSNSGIGALKACAFNATINACDTNPDWNAAVWLDPMSSKPVVPTSYATYQTNTTRQIITRSGSAGVVFKYTNLSASEKALLNIDPTTKVTDAPTLRGSDRIDYLRGDSSNEIVRAGGVFRTRTTTKLGDIVGSGTVYVGAPNSLFSGPLFSGYAAHISTYASRSPVLYVGANDGMLHAFDATTGKEVFAYVPNYFLRADATTTSSMINSLTMPTYQHQFYVDATPMVGDVKIGGNWKTMLVGGFGAGGKGFYALDVTDPNKFTTSMNAESNASSISMWEISNADTDYSDMGYTFNQPSLSPVSSQPLQYALIPTATAGVNQWAIIVGNGFGSASGKAVLYFIKPSDGTLITSVVVDSGTDNGLATPLPIDTTGDGVVDTVWVGDLKGDMWRVRWNPNTNVWAASVAFDGTKPITSAPAATPHPNVPGAWAVVFGTGKYIERSDYNTTTQQTLYGFSDTFSNTPITVSDLVQQTVGTATTPNAAGDFTRTPSSNAVNFTSKKGWYFDMPTTNGERSTVNPVIPPDTGIVLMSSFTPASACLSATGYVNILDAYTGGATDQPSWGGIGMGIPYFSSVVSSAGKVVVVVGGVRYGSSVTDPTQDSQSRVTKTKSFVKGSRFSWREMH